MIAHLRLPTNGTLRGLFSPIPPMENPTKATASRAPKLHSKAVLMEDAIAHDRDRLIANLNLVAHKDRGATHSG
jgi:hypothetical protein